MGFCKNIMQVATGLKSDKIVCLMNSAGTWQYNPSFTLDFGEIITLIGTYAYGLTVTSNVHEFVRNKHKTEYSADGTNWTTINNGKCFVDARYVRMTNDNGGHDRYIEGMAVGVKKSGGRKNSLSKRVFALSEHLWKKVSLMGFCRNILPNGSGKNPFPGYELKVGELCSLPALTTNDSSARILNIPAGCIPVCIRMDATFKANSGKGETPDLVLDVRDNNGNILFRACRNGAGQIYNNGTAYLCPLGAYNGDLERAKTCTQIHVRAHNDSAWLYSDYQYGKVAVTMWLEKVGA